jgi:hypothetical protein
MPARRPRRSRKTSSAVRAVYAAPAPPPSMGAWAMASRVRASAEAGGAATGSRKEAVVGAAG